MPYVTQGDINLGVGQASGGGYVVVRALFGHDFSPLFFAHGGAQMRTTYTFDRVAPGFQAVFDIGTRIGDHGELGFRGFVGLDGLTTEADPDRQSGRELDVRLRNAAPRAVPLPMRHLAFALALAVATLLFAGASRAETNDAYDLELTSCRHDATSRPPGTAPFAEASPVRAHARRSRGGTEPSEG